VKPTLIDAFIAETGLVRQPSPVITVTVHPRGAWPNLGDPARQRAYRKRTPQLRPTVEFREKADPTSDHC
jgi:hypothetical protein